MEKQLKTCSGFEQFLFYIMYCMLLFYFLCHAKCLLTRISALFNPTFCEELNAMWELVVIVVLTVYTNWLITTLSLSHLFTFGLQKLAIDLCQYYVKRVLALG